MEERKILYIQEGELQEEGRRALSELEETTKGSLHITTTRTNQAHADITPKEAEQKVNTTENVRTAIYYPLTNLHNNLLDRYLNQKGEE